MKAALEIVPSRIRLARKAVSCDLRPSKVLPRGAYPVRQLAPPAPVRRRSREVQRSESDCNWTPQDASLASPGAAGHALLRTDFPSRFHYRKSGTRKVERRCLRCLTFGVGGCGDCR